ESRQCDKIALLGPGAQALPCLCTDSGIEIFRECQQLLARHLGPGNDLRVGAHQPVRTAMEDEHIALHGLGPTIYPPDGQVAFNDRFQTFRKNRMLKGSRWISARWGSNDPA